MATGEVSLELKALTGVADELVLPVEPEGCLVPRDDLVSDLVRVRQTRSRMRLPQVDEGHALPVDEGAEDPLPGRGFLRGQVGREAPDVDDFGDADGLTDGIEGSGHDAEDAGGLEGILSGGENLPPGEFVNFGCAQGCLSFLRRSM